MALSSLQAAGIIERDTDGSTMWTWSYPMFTDDKKRFVLSKCCLKQSEEAQKKQMDIIPFVYGQYSKHWFYIFTIVVDGDSLNGVSHFAIVLESKDFNPEKYAVLCRLLSSCYEESGNAITLLEQYLKVITMGSCQKNGNGIFKVKDFDSKRAYCAASLKDVIQSFGVESIYLYTAVLLKKRILIFHDKVELLLELTRSLPALAWHRQDWSILLPWIDDEDPITDLPHFIAGTLNSSLKDDDNLYDVYVDAVNSSIEVAEHAKESLTLGKIHKDIARTMMDLSCDDDVTNEQLIQAIDKKTKDVLAKLQSLGGDEETGVTIEDIKSKNLNPVTESFLINLAAVERLIRL